MSNEYWLGRCWYWWVTNIGSVDAGTEPRILCYKKCRMLYIVLISEYSVANKKTESLTMFLQVWAVRSDGMKIDNSSFERVEEFKYWRTTLTNKNSIQEEIKGRFMSGNGWYHSVQTLLSSSLLSINLKIKIYRTIILPVLYGRETWSLILVEERRLTVFENRVLGMFGSKRTR
jgi:hypothetical protein